ncbi:MAG: cell wall-binding protein, partial [Spirochaetaceae bacterium]
MALAVLALITVISGCPTGLEGGGGNGTAPETYTVSYDANNATSGSPPETQTKTHGVDLILATNAGNLARTGYSFAGWN